MKEKLNIMEIIKRDENLVIFSRALAASELERAVQENGPFTILAPTDIAFAALSGFEDLLSSEKKPELKDLLASQIIKGRLRLSDLKNQPTIETLSGRKLVIKAGDGLGIDESKVVRTDIVAANGIVHMFNNVVMPRTASQSARA